MTAGAATGPAVAGDSGASADAALDTFCRAQLRRLVGMLGLYTGDHDLAEELAQEALVRLCRHWRQLPTEADAERWLNRVAMNLAKSSWRSTATRRRILDRFGSTLVPEARREVSTTDALAVRAAVAALPERERRALILRYYADLPVLEVAALLGCPEGTVKTLTHQAIKRLRQAGLEVTK